MDEPDFKVIVTVGPSTEDEKILKRINKTGPCIFRINGAYVPSNKVKGMFDLIKSAVPNAKILLDFPSDKEWFKKRDKKIKTTFLGKKDISLINKACLLGIDYLGMSHVNDADNIVEVKNIIKKFAKGSPAEKILNKPRLICKIETTKSLINLDNIMREVSCCLIDREDLAYEIGMNELPKQIEIVTEAAILYQSELFIATDFLRTMEHNYIPSIPESCDLYKTIQSGVTGIQLSQETAIGHFPVESVQYVFNLYKIYMRSMGVAWNPNK